MTYTQNTSISLTHWMVGSLLLSVTDGAVILVYNFNLK